MSEIDAALSVQLTVLRNGLRIMALRTLKDADAANEVVQESLARLMAAVREGRLADPARIGAFARGIASHVIVDAVRVRTRHVSLDAQGAPLRDPAADALSGLASREQAARVRDALASLSDDDREILRPRGKFGVRGGACRRGRESARPGRCAARPSSCMILPRTLSAFQRENTHAAGPLRNRRAVW